MKKREILVVIFLWVIQLQAMKKTPLYSENDLKAVWSVGKYHTKIVRLPSYCTGKLYSVQYHMRFDFSGKSLVCTLKNNDVCVIPIKEFVSESEIIKRASVRPLNLKIDMPLFQSIIHKASPRATCKGFDYTAYNKFRDCCSNGAVFAGWCPRIITEYNMFYMYQDCIGLYDTDNGMSFQFIPLPQKYCVNGRGIAFNHDGTVLAVLLANNTVALITPHKRFVFAQAFEDVIVNCVR